jgi:DNA-binding XRE family transcriptional regulator
LYQALTLVGMVISGCLYWHPCMTNTRFLIRLGARIKQIRIDKNFTQSQLAKECAFEKASMSRIEAGKTNVRILTLKKIAKKLKVTLNYLCEE